MARIWFFLFSLTASVLSPVAASAQSPGWQVESSEVRFTIRNAGLTVNGRFGGVHSAAVQFDPQQPEKSSLVATVMAATLDTGIGARDRHLKGEDYFYATRYPEIRMQSVRIRRSGTGLVGVFQLTLKGQTREVEFPFTFTPKGSGGTFAGSFTINRRDFGVGGSSWILADTVTVHLVLNVRS